MPLCLFAHPFSSYCQKVLVALYENDTSFTFRMLDHSDPATLAEFERLWPLRRFPILVDGQRTIMEATIIIEHLGLHHPGPTMLIPEDPDAALECGSSTVSSTTTCRRRSRRSCSMPFATPMCAMPRAWARRERCSIRPMLGSSDHIAGREWAVGDGFGLADCAAAPALFYADWTHPIGKAFPNVSAYRNRLMARPSFARAIDEARPYRAYFPLGAPDRD